MKRIEVDSDSTLQPPRKEDVLFRGDLTDWSNNACLNVRHDGDQIAYTEGYRRGAARLVEYVVENQHSQDYMVYPIVFLYRHHVELVLKRIIPRAAYLLERALTSKEEKHLEQHGLDLLWKDLEPMLGDIADLAGWRRIDTADVDGITDYIRQLTEVDSNSFSFRYTHSKKGTRTLPKDLRRINLRHFAAMMERLASYLDGIDMGTSQLMQDKAEMEA